MQLEVKPYELPDALTFNYEELKTQLAEKVHIYKTIVYGDDQIKQAKSDRADLNKLKKALSDERIRRKKEYLAPFEEFEKKINEIIAIIDEPAALIDAQIKEYEQQKKEEKRQQIREAFEKIGFPEYITVEKIWDDSWLNSSCSLSRIREDFKTAAYKDEQAVQMIQNLPEFSFEAMEYYKQSLDVTAAMAKANEQARIAKAKKAAEEEAARRAEIERMNAQAKEAEQIIERAEAKIEAQTPEEAPGKWVKFEAYLNVESAAKMREFFDKAKIPFRPVR